VTYPLHLCAYLGRKEIAEILLNNGADPNILDKKNGVFL